MAYEVNANGAIAKVRNPWGVLGLSLITLGIYTIFWYYYINKEFKEYGAAQGDQELAESQPGMSVLAITLGALIIVPAVISFVRTVQREQRVQELGGVEKVNGWIVADPLPGHRHRGAPVHAELAQQALGALPGARRGCRRRGDPGRPARGQPAQPAQPAQPPQETPPPPPPAQ